MTTWNGSLVEPLVGEFILAEDIHEMYDALKAVSDAWTSYTPTWSASGTAVSLGNGTISGKYRQVRKWVEYKGLLTMGSTTTYGTGVWRLTLPVPAFATDLVGSAQLLDSGTQDKAASCYTFSSTLLIPVSSAGACGPTAPHAWAVNDLVRWHISYEAA